jgi:hypothetical protein
LKKNVKRKNKTVLEKTKHKLQNIENVSLLIKENYIYPHIRCTKHNQIIKSALNSSNITYFHQIKAIPKQHKHQITSSSDIEKKTQINK